MRPKRMHEERARLREELDGLELLLSETDDGETLCFAEARVSAAVREHAVAVGRKHCGWLLRDSRYRYVRKFVMRGLTS